MTIETAHHGNEIAIIGMAGQFPGASDLGGFWENLSAGVESISAFSEEELAGAGVEAATLHDPHYVRSGAVLEDITGFDAGFFGFPPREAAILDPQQRLFLECAWAALEQAGYSGEAEQVRVGVFAGTSLSTYLLANLYPNSALLRTLGAFQIVLANDKDFLPTRVSYKLNLKGPSVNVNTAGSTSLVAVHLACQSLLNAECDLALAGGVSIRVPHRAGYWYYPGGVHSPDGHCRAFGAQAQGTVPGNGVGVVVLKRLDAALADRDFIYAVIKGSAINNDGARREGYTAPGVEGQAEVIAEALALAEVAPETISYVETHGNATLLGDPTEIAALRRAYEGQTSRTGFCAVGSVKSNIGHLDAAAGMAGLIKTVLALQHRRIPPTLHCSPPNPQIDFANSAFYLPTRLADWPASSTPRRAGVSALGIGGTNAHLILQEAPPREASGEARPYQLLLLSAKSSAALEQASGNLASYLRRQPDVALADVAYTLQVGRRAFSHRRMLVCQQAATASQVLEAREAQQLLSNVVQGAAGGVVLVFPGLGEQYVGMAHDLYLHEPAFRATVDRCAELLAPQLGCDFRQVLYPHAEPAGDLAPPSYEPGSAAQPKLDLRKMLRRKQEGADAATQALNQTLLIQPVLFVIEYALAQLWMAWGIRPQALLGYSLGEYVAACLAGVLTLEDALFLVAQRARLIHDLPEGAMLAVPLPEHKARRLLDARLSLAAVNGPSLCVVAGPADAIADLAQQLTESGLACQRIQTRHALHSTMMAPIAEAFAELVGKVELKAPQIPYVSNVTGRWIEAAEATDPHYWARQLCQSVRLADGLATVLEVGDVLLEVGPGQSLGSAALALAQQSGRVAPLVLPSLAPAYQRQPDHALLLTSLGKLWLAGVPIDWAGFYAHESRLRLPLPTYPFQHQSYWIDPPGAARPAGDDQPAGADEQPLAAGPLYPRPSLLNDYVAPRTEFEHEIAAIWQAILGIEHVGIHDNFMALGGQSLLATMLVSQLRDAFQVEMPLPRFFEAPTVAQLAEVIEELLIEKIEGLSEDEAERLALDEVEDQ